MKQVVKTAYLSIRKFLLSLFSVFIPGKHSAITDALVSKILFVRIDRIGDMVLSTPAIKALKQAYPWSEVTVLASPSNKDVLRHNPNIDRIMVYDKRLRFHEKWDLIRHLKNFRFDLAVDPYTDYELLTALIVFFSGAPDRAGYGSAGREVFFNIETPSITDGQHFIEMTLDVLKPLKVKAVDLKPEIFLSADEKTWAREWITRGGLGQKPLVGMHPGAYYESQRWQGDNFAELIDLLHDDGNADVLLFGGPGDKALCQRIEQKAATGVHSFLTNDIRKFSALLASCRVLICNNSGPLHMAVALNVPTISTMGPTNKERWMPIGHDHQVFRIDDLPCIGCNLGYCKIKTHDCMRLITPGKIFQAIEEKIFNNQPVRSI